MADAQFTDEPAPESLFSDTPAPKAEKKPGIIRQTFDALTYPVRHPVKFASEQGLTLVGAAEGAAAGGEAGAALGPVGAGLGALGGAYVGGFGGSLAQSGAEKIGNKIGANNPPEDLGGSLSRANEAGTQMAAGEAGGRVIGKYAGKLAGAAAEKLIPRENPSMTALEKEGIAAAQRIGVPLRLDQLTQSKTAQQAISLARRMPGTADQIEYSERLQTGALESERARLLADIDPHPVTPLDLHEKVKTEMGAKIQGEDEMAQKIEESRAREELAKKADFDSNKAAQADAALGALGRSGGAVTQRFESQAAPIPPFPEDRGAALLASSKAKDAAMWNWRDKLYARGDAEAAKIGNARITPQGLNDAATANIAAHPEGTPKAFRGKSFTIANEYLNPSMPKSLKDVPPEVQEFVKKNTDPATWKGSGPNGTPTMKEAPLAPLIAQAKQLSPEQIKAITNQGTFSPAELRMQITHLGEAAEEANNRGDLREAKKLGDLRTGAKKDLDQFYSTTSKEAQRRYQIADAFHGKYADAFRNKTIKTLYGDSPDKTFLDIAQSGNHEDMDRLARAVGVDGKRILKRQLWDNVFGETGNFPDEKSLTAAASKYGAAIRSLYTPVEQKEFKNFIMTGNATRDYLSATKADEYHAIQAPKFIQDEYDAQARSMMKSGNTDGILSPIMKREGAGPVLAARAAKKYLPPSTFKLIGRQLAENILTSQAAPEAGFKSIRANLNTTSKELLAEFYPKSVVDRMYDLGNASSLLYGSADLANKPVSSANAAVAMTMAGMVLNPSRFLGATPIVLIAANKAAEAYTSEEGSRWLTTIMRTPAEDLRLPGLLQRGIKFGVRAETVQAVKVAQSKYHMTK